MWNSSWKATVNLVKRIPILYSLFNTFCGLNLSQDVYHYDNVQYFFVIWVFDFAFGIRWICLKNTILWWFFLVVICMRDFLLHTIATKPWIFTGGWFCRGTESIKEGLLGFQSVKCTCSIGVCRSWKTHETCAYACACVHVCRKVCNWLECSELHLWVFKVGKLACIQFHIRGWITFKVVFAILPLFQ